MLLCFLLFDTVTGPSWAWSVHSARHRETPVPQALSVPCTLHTARLITIGTGACLLGPMELLFGGVEGALEPSRALLLELGPSSRVPQGWDVVIVVILIAFDILILVGRARY